MKDSFQAGNITGRSIFAFLFWSTFVCRFTDESEATHREFIVPHQAFWPRDATDITGPEGVTMDEAKVTTVMEELRRQPVPDLRCVLEITRFYCHFIRGFCSIATPLTSCLKKSLKKLPWNSAVKKKKPLWCEKNIFITSPILKHPDSF